MSGIINNVSADPWIEHAKRIIKSDYGVNVSLEAKNKDLIKFGRSTQVQTTLTTLMGNKTGTFNETYVSDNLITTVSSSSTSDTTTLGIEGHTISGSNLTFVVQSVTLQGRGEVSLPTPLARCTRLYNSGATDFVGTIYAYEDDDVTNGVPDTGSKVHCIITAGRNQSEKASTSISSVDFWIVTKFYGDMLTKTGSFSEVILEVRRSGKVFREVASISASDSHAGILDLKPYYIVPPNSDVRLRAAADINGRDVSGGIVGALMTTV